MLFLNFGVLFMTIYAARLRQLRLDQKIMSKQIAELLNITPRNYQRYETGEVDPPTSKTIVLADYFDVSLDYLVGRSDNPKRN